MSNRKFNEKTSHQTEQMFEARSNSFDKVVPGVMSLHRYSDASSPFCLCKWLHFNLIKNFILEQLSCFSEANWWKLCIIRCTSKMICNGKIPCALKTGESIFESRISTSIKTSLNPFRKKPLNGAHDSRFCIECSRKQEKPFPL